MRNLEQIIARNAQANRIIRKLLEETTFPAWAGEDCRSCAGGRFSPHAHGCPYLQAVAEAEEFLRSDSDGEER